MDEERLAEIAANAKWIRMDAAQQGEEWEYGLASDTCELIAEVRRLRAKLDTVQNYADYYYSWQTGGELPMTFDEWLNAQEVAHG